MEESHNRHIQKTEPAGPLTINAVAEGLDIPTKASYHRIYDLLWSESDKINVKDMDINCDSFTLVDGAGTKEGRFVQDGIKALIGPVEAFYPATIVERRDDGQLEYIWPAEQETNSVCPLYTKTTLKHQATETFTLSSLGTMAELKVFPIIPQEVTLSSIEIGDREKSMSGCFTVDEQRQAVLASTGTPGSILLSIGEYKLSTAAKTFCVSIPAGSYENPYVILRTTDGRSMTMALMPFEATRGELCQIDLGVKADIPSATTGTAANKDGKNIGWVRLWPFGPRFATVNIGANKPQDYGEYYAYGTSNSRSMKDADMNIGNLSGNKDTAVCLWGCGWRMPVRSELEGIVKYCTSEWVKIDGHWGRRITGKDEYSGNSILLPASGYYNENVDGDDDWDEVNVAGDYRSSTWSGGYVIIARGSDVLHISADGIYYDENYLRPSCSSVRPVLDVQE